MKLSVEIIYCQRFKRDKRIERVIKSTLIQRKAFEVDDERQCKLTKGTPNTCCQKYSRNQSWLPLANVNSATCDCSQTPSSPTENCV